MERHVDGEIALDAYLRWGRGVHRAGLSLGDCFAYALAKQLDAPLAVQSATTSSSTDVTPAIQPT